MASKQKQRDIPFKNTAGSLHISDLVRKVLASHKIKNSTSKPRPLEIPMRASVGDYLLFADPQRRFSRVIKGENAGLRVDLHKESINAWLEFPNGEKIAGEEILVQIPVNSLTQLQRVNQQTVINILPSRLRKSFAGAGIVATLAMFTDFIPIVAEIALVLGVSVAILLERRIQFLATDECYVLLIDAPELCWYLIDALIHDDWK